MRMSRWHGWAKVGIVAAATLMIVGGVARADVYTKQVNDLFKDVPAELRSDTVLLPVAAKMEAPPAAYRSQREAALLGTVGSSWATAVQWAQKPAQTAVLDALAKVTKEGARTKAYVFAQAYGSEVQDLDLLSQGLYTELGSPELLAAARHQYLPALERVGVLAHVEASRLAEAGKMEDAVTVMINWMWFCRQMADRPFVREKRWGMDGMKLAAERIRDLVFTDIRDNKRSMDAGKVIELNKRLRDRGGFLATERIRMPEAEFVAREQLVNAIMGQDGKPSAATFGSALARTSASERPLRLFSAAAFWDGARSRHAGARETREAVNALKSDWEKRWTLDPFDRIVLSAGSYERVLSNPSLAAIQNGLGDIQALFAQRTELRTELAGARAALGVYGFWLKNRSWPVALPAVSPEFMQGVDADPYSRTGRQIEFFVPMRDTPKNADGQPMPHEVVVQPLSGTAPFTVPMNDKVFVIYSVGPDDDRGNASRATQSRRAKPGEPSGDYLLFPPMIGLERQRLVELNQLN